MRQLAEVTLEKAVRLARVVPRSQPLAMSPPTSCVETPPCASRQAESNSTENWIERQKAIPLPTPVKEQWLSIVEEIEPTEPRRPRIEEIQIACAKHYRVQRSDILSERRTADIVRPRQVGYYLSKMLTLRSLPEIGRRFGGRDHTSALSGIRKIERLRKVDAALELDLQTIALALGGSLAEAS